MAIIQSDPRTVPSARDERIIRRIMRLTLYTLAGMLLALVSVVAFGADVHWLELGSPVAGTSAEVEPLDPSPVVPVTGFLVL